MPSKLTASLHHIVYVIELDDLVLNEASFVAENMDHDPNLPCVYVGQTGLTAKQGFKNHKSGYKSSKYAHRYGIRLLPHLYEHIPAMTFDESKSAESQLAEELREEGYAVLSK